MDNQLVPAPANELPAKPKGRGRGKPFVKGDPRAGRPKGCLSKITVEARELAQKIVSDPEYLRGLEQRVKEGKAGAMESLLWHYAYGEPKKVVDLNMPPGFVFSLNLNGDKPDSGDV